MLILAGISINAIVGDNGIIDKAKKARDETDKSQAQEKLELELINLGTEKDIVKEYNENEYITNRLESKDMDVADDLVVVDDWLFEIDRTIPAIKEVLGKGKRNEEIVIYSEEVPNENYTNSTIDARIIYNGGSISSVKIRGEEVEYSSNEAGKYNTQKQVNENGKYSILVKDTDGNFQFATIDIVKITEDFMIYNEKDLETLKAYLNEGRTFEGKTVKVMSDVDLGTSVWTPINGFKGTFLRK